MTDCLVYWRYYREDIAEDPNSFNDEWYTKSDRFFNQVEPGDSLWVVVSGGPDYPDEWRLLQRIVTAKLIQEDEERPFHAAGYPEQSEKYDIEAQSGFAPVLRQLKFVSGKKIKLSGSLIGRAIQAIRPLSDSDTALLEGYSKRLQRL